MNYSDILNYIVSNQNSIFNRQNYDYSVALFARVRVGADLFHNQLDHIVISDNFDLLVTAVSLKLCNFIARIYYVFFSY